MLKDIENHKAITVNDSPESLLVLALEKSHREQEVLLDQLQSVRGELQKAVSMRDDFMAVVAHELLTPLNTLFLETQLRRMELDRGNAAIFNETYLNKMVSRDERQIQSMIDLIDDMRDISRIRSNRLSITPCKVDLVALLNRAAGNLQHRAASVGASITLQTPHAVHGEVDEFRIEQVMVNLLTNALRYGGGKPVIVTLEATSTSMQIDVQDHGAGISDADKAHLFEQFDRGVSKTAGHGRGLGLGLSLYISKQLVEAHGGTLSVKSQLGEGSVFSVVLPLAPPAGLVL